MMCIKNQKIAILKNCIFIHKANGGRTDFLSKCFLGLGRIEYFNFRF